MTNGLNDKEVRKKMKIHADIIFNYMDIPSVSKKDVKKFVCNELKLVYLDGYIARMEDAL